MRGKISTLVLLALAAIAVSADDCDLRGVKGHFTIDALPTADVEVGYNWTFKGAIAICGQCGWASVTGSPTISIDWGDGSSSPLEISMVGGLPHTTTAITHQYVTPSGVNNPYRPVATGKAYCVAGHGQFWMSVSSNGAYWSEYPQPGTDFSAAPAINVYAASRPTAFIVDNPLRVGLNKEALTAFVERPAPLSGTMLRVTSDKPNVKIVSATGTGQSIDFLIAPGNTSAVFGVDATGVPAGTEVKFTVSNVALSGGSITKGPVPIK